MPGLRLSALAAVLLLAAPVGCKKAPAGAEAPDAAADVDRTARAGGPARRGRADDGPRLPTPHRLSQEPDAGAFVADPAAALASLEAFIPQAPAPEAIAELILATQMPEDLAARLAPQIAGDRPWSAVHVAGEDILQLPLRPGTDLTAVLAGLPARGDFGAVQLPPPALEFDRANPGQRLAWFDRQTGNLAVARTEQGLATSRLLRGTYGARPLWGTVGDARAKVVVPEFPYARVAAVGDGLHALDLDAIAPRGQTLPALKDIAPGALTGMLAVPDLAVGASTRWPGHKKAVQDIIREMNAGVDRAGFAAKMMLDPMVDQAARVLRRWNGRVLVGIGPARHLRLGLGADEPVAAFKETAALFRTIIDNLQLARMFADVPGASLRQAADKPVPIFVLTVDGLARNVPAAARPVLDDKGRLRVAFAASERGGGLQVVIGPDPAPVLEAWLGHTGTSDADDLVAGALAVSLDQLQPLMQARPQAADLIGQLLQLAADRQPTVLVVQQKPDRFHATVRGPELAARRRAQAQAQAQANTAAQPTDPQPRTGKPARPAD